MTPAVKNPAAALSRRWLVAASVASNCGEQSSVGDLSGGESPFYLSKLIRGDDQASLAKFRAPARQFDAELAHEERCIGVEDRPHPFGSRGAERKRSSREKAAHPPQRGKIALAVPSAKKPIDLEKRDQPFHSDRDVSACGRRQSPRVCAKRHSEPGRQVAA